MSASTPSTTTVLDRILAETRAEVERRKRAAPLGEMLADGRARGMSVDGRAPGVGERRFHDAIRAGDIGVIAEFKRRSPSAGALRERPSLAEILAAYERGGAVAASILTEGPNFGGDLQDLRAAREACDLPLLRKDFIVDPYQLHEAVLAGADAVLLIVAALSDTELAGLHHAARDLGLDVLVEVHDREQLWRALAVGADIVGINNRDLRDFSVELERTASLMDDVPDGVAVVSESGISRAEQLQRLRGRGVAAVLVGEALMRSTDPAGAIAALRPAPPEDI